LAPEAAGLSTSAAGELSPTVLDPPARKTGEYRSSRTPAPGGGLNSAKEAVASRIKKSATTTARFLMEAS
jgi:hypothetical protein